jgi:hypothetical protein
MNPHYAQVAQRAGHRCEYCHAPEAVFNFPFEVEHVLPTARGGSDSEVNLALSCRSCNLHKAAHINGVDIDSQAVVRLFDPREDLWAEHFRADSESGEIAGLTAIGRATVARLAMNGVAQVAARSWWIRLGLFP